MSSPVLVEKVRHHSYEKPLADLQSYLDAMDAVRYSAVPPAEEPPRILAALGPRMLELAASRSLGAHPYLTTPEHTAQARQIMGPSALLAPEQMVVLDTDPDRARAVGRAALSFYLRAPGYLANLRRLGFGDDDWADPKAASDRLVDGVVAWGDVEVIEARVHQHFDAGADHVCLQALCGDRSLPTAEWRRLAEAFL